MITPKTLTFVICMALMSTFAASSQASAQVFVGTDFALSTGAMEVPTTPATLKLQAVSLPDAPRLDIDKELQFWLEKGKRAPYTGMLLNPEAVALILSEYLAQHERATASLVKQVGEDQSVLDLVLERHKAEIKTLAVKSEIQQKADGDKYKRLQKINEDIRNDSADFWGRALLLGGGLGTGFLLGILIGLGS